MADNENICPVCNHSGVDGYVDPIHYWGCDHCGTVFVMDAKKTIAALDKKVKYETE